MRQPLAARGNGVIVDPVFRSTCLELLRRDLTRYGMRESTPKTWPWRKKLMFHSANTMLAVNSGVLGRVNPFGNRRRELGLDWPAEALTMIGWRRLESLQECVEAVLEEDVPGDLVECGVWRG